LLGVDGGDAGSASFFPILLFFFLFFSNITVQEFDKIEEIGWDRIKSQTETNSSVSPSFPPFFSLVKVERIGWEKSEGKIEGV